MKEVMVFVFLLTIIANLVLLSESVWMTHEEFFSSFQTSLANIIEIQVQPCPGDMRRISLEECRKTY